MKCKVWIVTKYDNSIPATCVEFEWADLAIANAFVQWFNLNNSDKTAMIEAEQSSSDLSKSLKGSNSKTWKEAEMVKFYFIFDGFGYPLCDEHSGGLLLGVDTHLSCHTCDKLAKE